MTRLAVPAKINLALVVGGRRADGLHDVATVMQRVGIADRLELLPGDGLSVEGFAGDTIVRAALERLAAAAGVPPAWRVRLEKRIPLAAGLGGGSADAAAALLLANAALPEPLPSAGLLEVAAAVGSDVPFFLEPGPKLVQGGGEQLAPLDLPQDYWVLLVLPRGAVKPSTASVYARFDEQGGGAGFAQRRAALLAALRACRAAQQLAALPPNDLAPAAGGPPALAGELVRAGAFRADLSGAGPVVYGLFERRGDALSAARRLRRAARVWVTAPVW